MSCAGGGTLLPSQIVLHAEPIACDTTQSANASRDTISAFSAKILFPKNSATISRGHAGNSARIDSIYSFLSETNTGELLDVKIAGSYSPEGKEDYNKGLALRRAKALAALAKEINPDINPEISIKAPELNSNIIREQMRYAELQAVSRKEQAPCNTPEPDSGTQGIEAYTPVPLTEERDSRVSEQADETQMPRDSKFSPGVFVGTNMLYDAALIPNICVGVKIADRVVLSADWMYARWNNHDKRRYWRIYGGDIEVRCRIGAQPKGSPLGGHYLGAYGSLACYDFQTGRNHTGVLSDKYNYAVGVSYTYSLPVAAHFNIDFSLGVGYLWGRYKKHRPIDDCDVWLSTHRMRRFGPTRAAVSLVWLIGDVLKNERKGGDGR